MVDMSSDDAAVRLVSTYALEGYGKDASVAVPLLVVNLHDEDFDVRRAAAYVLGTLGPIASAATG
jgi:HEAT repeat protein